MKLRPPSRPVVQLIPALLAKKGRGSSFSASDRYDQSKPGSVLLDSSLQGLTPRERAREIEHLRSSKVLARESDHWSLSLDPRLGKLSDDQWRQVAKEFIEEMGFDGCAYTVTRHVDEPQDHIHLTLLRLKFRQDGSVEVVTDSNDFKRSHVAAARCAAAIGLQPLPPRPDAMWAPAPTDTQIGANKRAKRRGTKTQNHASLARTFDHIVSKSIDLVDLESKLLEVDVELEVVRKSGGSVQGLNVKVAGAEEWEKASGLKNDRSLSWLKVEVRLAANRELRDRAQAQAEQVAGAARDRAAQQVATRLGKQPQPVSEVSQPDRVLPPSAIDQAKEAITAMENDKLDFLSSPPPPRPPSVPLDDAALASPAPVPFVPVPGLESASDGLTALELRARDEAEIAFLRELRGMSVAQLLDLRRLDIPPLILTFAAVEAMVNLILKLLSFGMLKRAGSLESTIAARQRLQSLAADELARRRRTPQSQTDKRRALNEYVSALKKRGAGLGGRARNRTMPDGHAVERARRRRADLLAGHERAFDRYQVELGLPTIAQRRRELAEAAAAEKVIEDEVPAALGMVMLPRAKAEALASRADRVVRLARAARLRRIADMELQLFLLRVERATDERSASDAAAAAAAFALEVEEAELITGELKNLAPDILASAIAQDRERIGQAARGFIEATEVPPSEADLDAERESLRRLLRKGG